MKSVTEYATFNQDEFDQFILDQKIVGIFPEAVKLASGKMSNWYINWRQMGEDAWAVDQASDHIIRFLIHHKINADCLYGVPEGGTKLALITQFKWACGQSDFGPQKYSLPMGRGKPKTHGPDEYKNFIGAPKRRCLLLEDVVTTGGSILEHLKILKTLKDLEIMGVLVMSDRMEKNDRGQSVEDLIKDQGLAFYRMSSAFNLIPKVLKKLNDPSLKDKVMAELREVNHFNF